MRRCVLCSLFGLLLTTGSASGFLWQPNEIPPGNHTYALEISNGQADSEPVRLELTFTQEGESYSVDTVYRLRQTGLSSDNLGDAMFGSSMLGMFAFGPMVMYGPAFMMLPLVLGQEEIRVRSEPMIVMGLGRLYMDKTEEVAGFECVVLRFESSDGSSEPVEFALAEGLPFPCFSRYSNGDGTFTEVRLTEAS